VSEHYRSWIEPQQAAPLDLNGATAYFDFAERAGRDIRNKIASEPDLEIPRWFKVPRKAFLKSPVREFAANWDYFNDVLRNIAGFLPFGFLVCAYFACTRKWPQSILYATLAGGMLSFMVEVLQVYIPPRNSGITDIITNTTGAALGALLARSDLIRNILAKAISRNARETSDSTRG
jgi:VanZ family protein